MVVSEDLRSALKNIVESGYQISADGFEYLKTLSQDEINKLMIKAIKKAKSDSVSRYVLDIEFLQSLQMHSEVKPLAHEIIKGRSKERPLANEYDSKLELLEDGEVEPDGSVEGFGEYFNSRFKRLTNIIRKRMDVRDAVTIGRALEMPIKSKFKVIGIVTRKRARGSRLFIDLEDIDNSVTVMASDTATVRKGLMILEDQVICVEAVKYRDDLLIGEDFIWPDVPTTRRGRSDVPICAAFLADIHVGSVHFMDGLFNRFVKWIKAEVGPPELRSLAARVKYVIVAGDLVDGIGVYPNQLKELNIKDIREQYKVAAALLSRLPDYVEIIVIPGNHDAVRKSLPQSPISKEYAEPLYQDPRFHMFGNPVRLSLNGVEVLISHGKSLDDVLSKTPGLDFNSPVKGIELLLRCRHVAPIYGASTPIAPEKRDRLVVDSIPDIFQMGHIHIDNSKRYKGITLIASGSWQEQTSFQKRMNLMPTPGIAPIVDLQTHQIVPIDFKMMGG